MLLVFYIVWQRPQTVRNLSILFLWSELLESRSETKVLVKLHARAWKVTFFSLSVIDGCLACREVAMSGSWWTQNCYKMSVDTYFL